MNDGGAAFPRPATPFERIEHAASRANAAKNVYVLADAMLAERAKKS